MMDRSDTSGFVSGGCSLLGFLLFSFHLLIYVEIPNSYM